jgi:hypothetical protein
MLLAEAQLNLIGGLTFKVFPLKSDICSAARELIRHHRKNMALQLDGTLVKSSSWLFLFLCGTFGGSSLRNSESQHTSCMPTATALRPKLEKCLDSANLEEHQREVNTDQCSLDPAMRVRHKQRIRIN